MKTVLSTETKDFLDKNISCNEELQILLMLHSQPGKHWAVVDVAEALQIEPLAASQHLMELHKKGLVRHQEQSGPLYDFQYRLFSETQADRVYELARIFETSNWIISDYLDKKKRTG